LCADPTPEGIAEQLGRLFAYSDEELSAVGRRGRELAATNYTWERIADQMVEVYDWLLGRAERPACVHLD
jgi:poly(glycerol-phosphate) alpha-glucosyltransferase